MTSSRLSTLSIAAICAVAHFAAPRARAQAAPIPVPRIDSIFAQYAKEGSPGCAVAVFRAGEVAFSKGYGLADVERNVPITPRSVFYIASTSKQFAAFSTVLLAQDGKLSLDDDVRKWVPELHDFGTRITIRNLLNHTSGLRDYFALAASQGWEFDGLMTDDGFLKLVSRQRALNFPPGSAYSYSNTGYVLLSIIVKRASGKSLADFAQERIFTPLGMSHSRFRDDHRRLIADRALAYEPSGKEYRLAVPNFDVVGDGGVFTSVEELAKWDGNFYTPVAGNAETWRLMRERTVLTSGDTVSYAKGLMVGSYRGTPAIEHGGAFGGYRAEYKRLPEKRLGTAILCNHAAANTTALANAVLDAVLGDSLAPVAADSKAAPATTAEERAALVGRFLSRAMEFWAIVDADSAGTLTVTTFFGKLPLVKVEAGRFRMGSFPLEFRVRRTAAGGVVREFGSASNGWDQLEPLSPKGGRIAPSIGGRFVNGETDSRIELKVMGDSIVANGSFGQALVFKPLGGDRYIAGPVVLTAAPGTRQLLLSTGRSSRVAYDRQ